MKAQHGSIAKASAAAALTLVLSTSLAGAQGEPAPPAWLKEKPEPQVELFLSSLFANSASEGSFGLRGAFPLGRRFALEGSLARLAVNEVDLWLVDVSAKYYLTDRKRTDAYVVAGPGLFTSDELGADEPMLHLGFGAEIQLGRRFYVRPELRGRWFADDVEAVNILDLSAGFGWRF